MEPLTLLGLGITAAAVGSLVGLHGSKVHVRRDGRWPAPPTVIVTSQAPVTLDEVLAGTRVLEQLGQRFEGVVKGDPPGPVEGAIVIRYRDRHVRPEHAGETRARISVNGRIRSVEVYLPKLDVREDDGSEHGFTEYSDDERARVVAHELAHACGWGHCSTAVLGRTKKGTPRLGLVGQKTGHLMHPHVDGGGWNTKGMV